MATLALQLLGGLQVSAAGRPVAVPSKKAQALLALLAMPPGRPIGRAKLAAMLWSDSHEAQARASLRQALLVLRRALDLDEAALGGGPGETVVLQPGVATVDAVEFERLLESDPGGDALQRAAGLYAGEFLEALDLREPAFDDWLMTQRQHLRERAIDAMTKLLAHHVDAGGTERAVEVALRLLALDPLQESVHRSLMQLYARQGREATALRQFQLCRDLLRRELAQEPQPETVRLWASIRQQRQAAAPSPPPADAAPPGPAGAELRLVAVLGVESARIADDPDAERSQAACARFAADVRACVERFGGTVDRQLGATVIALFGVPAAHGDDAARAARSALQLAAAHPRLRIGLAAGEVLVTPAPSASPRAFVVSGEVGAIATRLAAAADDGELLVSDAAWRLLAPLGDGTRCSHAQLAPSLRSAGAWRLIGLRAAPEARSGLVGRRAELAQFASALQACEQAGAGLTVHLRGEPGIGKTRLVDEFRALAAARRFDCHLGSVLDFGSGTERDAVRAVVRSLLRAQRREAAPADASEGPDREPRAGPLPLRMPADSAVADQAAVAGAIAAGLVDRASEVHLHELLQLEQPPELRPLFDAMDVATRERGQRDALSQLLLRCAARRPCLVVLEDLHWAGARTLAHVAAIAGAVERAGALLVTTARTEGDPLGSAWRAAAGVSAFVTLDLGPLRWAEASALAAQYGDAADAFVLRCVERSGGNPLFLEQLLHGGHDADALPATVQSVVQARLDRLPADERHAVRVASVLGQRFPLAALDRLLGAGHRWQPLLAQGLLRAEGDEGVYAHALVHEGAYASLPRSRRRELHAEAAAWYDGRDAALRAQHLDRAGDPAAAAAYLVAARAEAALHRHGRARELAERGLAVASDDGPRHALACCRADVLHDMGAMGDAQVAYEEALAAAGDDAGRCRAWIGLAAVKRVRDDLDGAADALAQAERIGGALGLDEPLARVHLLRGNLLFPRGDVDGCLREHARSLERARAAKSIELEAAALGGIGDVEFMRGRMLTALERFAACVELARQRGLKRVEAANLPMAAIARSYAGDAEAALRDARTAIDVSVQIGHRRAEMIAHHGGYQLCHARRQFDAALEHAERALLLAQQLDAPRFVAEALAFRGELSRTIGRRAAAVDDLRQAVAIARATGMAFMGPVFLGMLALAADDEAGRRDALAEAEQLLATNGLAHNHLLFRRDAIDACLEAGDRESAVRHADALDAYTRHEPLPWSRFHAARGRALAACAAQREGDAHALDAELARLLADGRAIGQWVALEAIERAASAARGLPQSDGRDG